MKVRVDDKFLYIYGEKYRLAKIHFIIPHFRRIHLMIEGKGCAGVFYECDSIEEAENNFEHICLRLSRNENFIKIDDKRIIKASNVLSSIIEKDENSDDYYKITFKFSDRECGTVSKSREELETKKQEVENITFKQTL